jgi:hypothetical protein
MSGSTRTFRRQREALWRKDPHCHWCGCLTILWKSSPKNKVMPHNAATLDHLDSRMSPERGKHPGERRHVLACYRCNQDRCDRDLAANIELQREKSGAYPQWMIGVGAD